MYRYSTIFIFLCALVSAANAQSFSMADSLFAAGDYELAAVEYERCVYQSESRQATQQALRKKALCYKALNRYSRAAETQSRCTESYGDWLQLTLYSYLAADFSGAATAAANATMLCDTVGEDLMLLQMLALNELTLYDSARIVADKLVAHHLAATGDDISSIVDSIYSRQPSLKSEKLGWYLSFVPGLGHVYAGEVGLGLAAFAMNAAVLGFGVWQVFEGCYITAYMGGAGLLSVTYPGAMHSAAHYIKRTNYLRTSAFNNSLRQGIMDAMVKGDGHQGR